MKSRVAVAVVLAAFGCAGGTTGQADGSTQESTPDGSVPDGSVAQVPVISSFTGSPGTIASGQSSVLSWTVSGATSLGIDQGVGDVTGITSKSVSPGTTTTYTLTATNAAGTASASATVSVSAPATYVASRRTIQSGGVARAFVLARPDPMPAGTALPLVFSLHGDGGDGAGMRAALPLEAQAAHGAVFVYPDAPGGSFEYWTFDGRSREAQFVRDVIAALSAELAIDTSRVFIAGMSGGATMANALGCRLGPAVIRGLGIHSGTLYPVDDAAGHPDFTYTNSGGVSCALPAAIFVWGKDDQTEGVSFAEGSAVRDNYLATQACAATTAAGPVSPCESYDACTRALSWCPVDGLGHSIWSDAAKAMWKFFDAQGGGAAAGNACAPAEKFGLWTIGKSVLRGANVFMGRNPGGAGNGIGDGDFAQADFDDLANAGANYVQISHAGLYGETPPYALDTVARDNLDAVLAMAAKAHLYAVIAFRSGPGRNENAITGRGGDVLETIWTDADAQAKWVEMLRYAAARYKDNPAVVGYDVMVEPNNNAHHGIWDPATFYANYGGTIEDFNRLAAAATAAIREVDATTPILLEPEGFGGISWLPHLAVTGDPRTVYTVHDYTPMDYTHELAAGASYPGTYDLGDGNPVRVDRAFLDGWLQPLRDFSGAHDVPVAVTEFGAHRTASNAATYLQDRVELQDGIGNWAAWVWQPAHFSDPFTLHDASAAHDVLAAAWNSNCH